MARQRVNPPSPPSDVGEFPPTDPQPLPPCMNDKPKWAIPSKQNRNKFVQALDERFRETYGTLHEWLTLAGIDGKMRQTGSMVLFCEEGRWKACLNDKDTHQVAFLTADSFTRLLEAADEGLAKGDLDWRESKRK